MKWYIIHYLFLKQVEKSGIFFDFCYNNRKHSSNYRFMPDFCILRIATVTMNLIVCSRYLFGWTCILQPSLIAGFRILFCQYTLRVFQLPFVRKQIQKFLAGRLLVIGHSGDDVIQVIPGIHVVCLASCQQGTDHRHIGRRLVKTSCLSNSYNGFNSSTVFLNHPSIVLNVSPFMPRWRYCCIWR